MSVDGPMEMLRKTDPLSQAISTQSKQEGILSQALMGNSLALGNLNLNLPQEQTHLIYTTHPVNQLNLQKMPSLLDLSSQHCSKRRATDKNKHMDYYYIIQNIQFFFMLSINWQHARKHQTNHSPTKAAFGFGKDTRFKYGTTTLCDSFYNIPSQLGKAPASGIGKGSKVKILNSNTFTPSPQNYNVDSRVSLSRKGIKFGVSRDKVQCNGIFNKSDTPEPGHYDYKSDFASKKGFTIYSKIALPTFSNAKTPGPAHYRSTQSLSSSGRYVLSQLTNCPGYKIKPSKPSASSAALPGPGQYESDETLNATGRYCNSKNENSRCRTFSRSPKMVESKQKLPGPGAYNYYSEFGKKQ